MQRKGRKPGVYYDLSNEDYHNDPAISNSDIKKLLKSPLEYWTHSNMNPDKPHRVETPAMAFGTALHCYLLERDKFDERYIILPSKLEIGSEFYERVKNEGDFYENFVMPKTKTAKTFKYIGDKIVLKNEEYVKIKKMIGYLNSLPVVGSVFKNGKPEVSVFWCDEEAGLMCKCRFDYIATGYIVDYKSIISVDKIKNAIADFDYYIQQAFYLEGLKQAKKLSDDFKDHNENYTFVFQQKEAPHLVRIKSFNEDVVEHGEALFNKGLEIARDHFERFGSDEWKEDPKEYCLRENIFMGFEDLPSWLQYKYNLS